MFQFRIIFTLEISEESNPYALWLVKEINYKDSVDIIQLKWELLTYLISPDMTFFSHYGQKVWIHYLQIARIA